MFPWLLTRTGESPRVQCLSVWTPAGNLKRTVQRRHSILVFVGHSVERIAEDAAVIIDAASRD
jgi:hypothetical protein